MCRCWAWATNRKARNRRESMATVKVSQSFVQHSAGSYALTYRLQVLCGTTSSSYTRDPADAVMAVCFVVLYLQKLRPWSSLSRSSRRVRWSSSMGRRRRQRSPATARRTSRSTGEMRSRRALSMTSSRHRGSYSATAFVVGGGGGGGMLADSSDRWRVLLWSFQWRHASHLSRSRLLAHVASHRPFASCSCVVILANVLFCCWKQLILGTTMPNKYHAGRIIRWCLYSSASRWICSPALCHPPCLTRRSVHARFAQLFCYWCSATYSYHVESILVFCRRAWLHHCPNWL